MKKPAIPLVTALLLATGADAQTEFGLKAGVNFSSYSWVESETLADTKLRMSFHLTGYLDARIAPGFYLHPEVSLQGKGARLIESSPYGGGEIVQSTMWLDFPINFLGKVPVGNMKNNVFAGAGPYVGFSMNGENTYADGSTSAVIIYKDNAMKSADHGINFLAGFKWNWFSLNANYRLGLANIVNSTYKWSNNIKNRVLSLGLGVSL